MIVAIIVGVYLPESSRYLIQKKEFHKAFLVLKKIWIINGKKSNDIDALEDLLSRNHTDFKAINTSIIEKFDLITSENKNFSTAKNEKSKSAFQFIFESRKSFVQTLLLILIWFSVTLTYYGKMLKKIN